MTAFGDACDLPRFVAAQQPIYDQALAELRAGDKQSHWMWFIFPQLAGLGRSTMAARYGIASIDEARAYLAHPLLGPRLRESVEALLEWRGRRGIETILGSLDAIKLRSSLTLFGQASDEPVFGRALDAFFDGRRDEQTLALLGMAPAAAAV
jgi:uncharacterized protein (DUF1810 family)